MKTLKYIIFLTILMPFVQAKNYSIIAFSTKVIYAKDTNKFLKRYSSGIIEKQKNYYVFKISNFKNYKEAKKRLPKIKRYYHDAFVVTDTSLAKKSKKGVDVVAIKNFPIKALVLTDMSIKTKDKKNPIKKMSKIITKQMKKGFIQKNIDEESPTKPIHLKESELSTQSYHIPLASKKISNYDKRPKLNEPKILNSYQIPNLYKTIDTKKYDILNLNRYISALFNYNDSAHQGFYQKKIDYLLSEIKKDRYIFDVYIDGYIKTGKDVATNNGNNTNVNTNTKYTDTGVAINANKLLYDGQYRLINHVYNILDKRLADIKELNAKERLIILGTSIYTNMYISQEELIIFKKILKKQEFIKKIVDERYKQGKDSILDYINSQTDLINLKRAILDLRYKYLHNDYILRHSIKSRSEKPFLLLPAKIHLNMESLVRLQKEAIKQNSTVAIESNILKIKQTDLLSQKRRYYPQINFNSYLGYGLSKDDTFSLSGAGRGAYWGIGLTFKIPIYERDDIRLNKEKERYNILKQNSIFSAKQRDVLIQVEKSYNEVIRIKKQKQFLEELLALNDKKMKIIQEKYISGISPYKDYSDGIKDFLNYKNQLIQMKQDYIKEMSILSILVGKRKFYEQN